jgi:hypothetical protein
MRRVTFPALRPFGKLNMGQNDIHASSVGNGCANKCAALIPYPKE